MPKSSASKGLKAIVWWVIWISATIISFFIAAAVWTPIIAAKFGSIYETRAGVFWVIAVFGTWMIFLVPLIIFMYQKVDKAYEDARINREKAALKFRSVNISRNKRILSANLSSKIAGTPETIQGGHLVSLKLKDGREFSNVFVQNRNEIIGIYDQREMPFEVSEIEDLTPADLNQLPQFNTNKWLRLDGVTTPE